MEHGTLSVVGVNKRFYLPKVKKETVREHVFGFLRKSEVEVFNALSEVSFEVRRGEFFGIIGPNGSGKSTLLKVLAGIYCADGGQVRVRGKVSPFLELGIGFNVELTGRENVFLNGILLGMSRREVQRRFDAIVEFAGLERFMDVPLKHYSSGMQARLAFSVAIQVDADIFLLDEVLAVGDGVFQEQCFEVFRRFKKEGKTIVFVTHGLGSVREFCDRAILLKLGKVRCEGVPDMVLGAYDQSMA